MTSETPQPQAQEHRSPPPPHLEWVCSRLGAKRCCQRLAVPLPWLRRGLDGRWARSPGTGTRTWWLTHMGWGDGEPVPSSVRVTGESEGWRELGLDPGHPGDQEELERGPWASSPCGLTGMELRVARVRCGGPLPDAGLFEKGRDGPGLVPTLKPEPLLLPWSLHVPPAWLGLSQVSGHLSFAGQPSGLAEGVLV